MLPYLTGPLPFGVNLVTELSSDNLYRIARSQTAVFPFKLGSWTGVKISATHTNNYANQSGTISAWASDEINGRSITQNVIPNYSRINVFGTGFTWFFHIPGIENTAYPQPAVSQAIDPDKWYFMCFQNLENKDNGFYVAFEYLF